MEREQIQEHVILGHTAQTETGVRELLSAGVSVDEIIQKVLVPAMAVVGEKFRRNEIFVPEMLIAARAMQAGLNVLEPLILQQGRQYLGKVVIGTVKGDLHDIGKKLVATMLQGAGWDVIDLGVDVSPGKFLAAVREHKPAIVGLSALLTTTMPNMKAVIDLLKADGVRDKVRVMVGGAPVTEKYAREIGADGFAADAGEAVETCAAFVA
ncbi:methionine synthase [Peptococcaceae bacterium CEB3]|nr:methionine synthase [Peptococcaceae bacterium CEB3]